MEYFQLDQKWRISLYTQKPVLQYSDRFLWVKNKPHALPIYRLFFLGPNIFLTRVKQGCKIFWQTIFLTNYSPYAKVVWKIYYEHKGYLPVGHHKIDWYSNLMMYLGKSDNKMLNFIRFKIEQISKIVCLIFLK